MLFCSDDFGFVTFVHEVDAFAAIERKSNSGRLRVHMHFQANWKMISWQHVAFDKLLCVSYWQLDTDCAQ